MFLLLLLFLLPFTVNSVFVCPKVPVLLHESWGAPQDLVTPGTTCQFMISYPPISSTNSTFALVNVAALNTTAGDSIVVQDTFRNRIDLTIYNNPLAFPPPSLTFTITAAKNSTMVLGFSVVPMNFNPVSKLQNFYTLAPNAPAQLIELRQMMYEQYNVFRSNGNQVVLSVATLGNFGSRDLMNSFIYDGETSEDNLLGTLFNIFQNGPITSKNGGFTIYCPYGISIDGVIMVTDPSNIAQYSSYNLLWSEPTSAVFNNFELWATNGPAAVTIVSNFDYSDTFYLTGVTFPPSSNDTQLKAYAQTPLANSSLMIPMAAYTTKNTNFGLPQHFYTYASTFVLEKRSANLQFTTYKSQEKDSVAFNGRTGFISTLDYGIQSTNLNSSTFELHSDKPFTTEFVVSAAAPASQVNIYDFDTLQIQVIPINLRTFLYHGTNFAVTIYSTSKVPDIGTLLYYSVSMSAPVTPTKPPHTETTTRTASTTGFTALLIACFSVMWM